MWARSTRYHIEKLRRLQFRSGENQLHVVCSQSFVSCFTQDLAEICGDCQIAVLIQLLGRHAWPLAIDFATFNGPAENEHDISVPVIGSTGTVLLRRTPELGHGYEDYILRVASHIGPESGDALAEVAQAISQLSVHATLILMCIPAADISEGGFHAQIRLQQLRNLLHVVAECPVG